MAWSDRRTVWDLKLARHFNVLGVGHGGYGLRYNEFLYRAKARAFHAALARNALSIRDRSVLDVGCGTGFFRDLSKELQCGSYTGLDVARSAIDRLAGMYPTDKFRVADISDPLDSELVTSGPYDFVYCLDVIYYVTEPARFQRAVDNLWSLLKPDGHLLISDAFSERASRRTGGTHELRFRALSEYDEILFQRPDFEMIDLVPMYYLFNRPLEARRFPLMTERLSWHVRHRLFESRALLRPLYAVDTFFVDRVKRNANDKVLVGRKADPRGVSVHESRRLRPLMRATCRSQQS